MSDGATIIFGPVECPIEAEKLFCRFVRAFNEFYRLNGVRPVRAVVPSSTYTSLRVAINMTNFLAWSCNENGMFIDGVKFEVAD